MGLVLLGKEERPKCVRNPSKLRQNCVKNARNTFGGEHLLDDTDKIRVTGQKPEIRPGGPPKSKPNLPEWVPERGFGPSTEKGLKA